MLTILIFESQIESFSIISKDISIRINGHDIPWFKVSVDDILDMHEGQSQNAISEDGKELFQAHGSKLSLF